MACFQALIDGLVWAPRDSDSANIEKIDRFRNVQARINTVDPAFAVLLGDNVYDSGTHNESDARFDPTINPEAAVWTARHIDYVGFGNHDVKTDGGQPGEDNFSVPIPVAGVTAPAAPPAGEQPEHNYSFDYGNVHFVTFDTNSLSDAARLDGQLTWVEADLAASSAQWKIVFGHHPVTGSPDKPESAADDYYQQVVPRLRAAGVDVFLMGHSHTYHRTFPLLGGSGGVETFVLDTDNEYDQGAGLIQLVAGVGGKSLRSGTFTQYPFNAAGFSTSTIPRVEYGFAQFDVTPNQLTVSYIAADDGATLDQFKITSRPNATAPTASLLRGKGIRPSDPDTAGYGGSFGRRSVSNSGDLVSAAARESGRGLGLAQGGSPLPVSQGTLSALFVSSIGRRSGSVSSSLSASSAEQGDQRSSDSVDLITPVDVDRLFADSAASQQLSALGAQSNYDDSWLAALDYNLEQLLSELARLVPSL